MEIYLWIRRVEERLEGVDDKIRWERKEWGNTVAEEKETEQRPEGDREK